MKPKPFVPSSPFVSRICYANISRINSKTSTAAEGRGHLKVDLWKPEVPHYVLPGGASQRGGREESEGISTATEEIRSGKKEPYKKRMKKRPNEKGRRRTTYKRRGMRDREWRCKISNFVRPQSYHTPALYQFGGIRVGLASRPGRSYGRM